MERRVPGLVLLCISLVFACEPSPDPSAYRREGPPVVPEAPPGEGALGSGTEAGYRALIVRAEQARGARRSIEALRLYRQAWVEAPATVTAEERLRVKAEIERLAFLLGVPDGVPDLRAMRKPSVSESDSPALRRARRLYADARKLSSSDKGQAMTLLREILATVSPSEDSSLYWRAWQRLEDLSPEGEGPAAIQERIDRAEDEEGAEVDPDLLAKDGRFIAGAPPAAEHGRADDINLSRARSAYVRGMEYAQANEKILARESFREVLGLIRESQDPELVRSAEQNLRALEDRSAP